MVLSTCTNQGYDLYTCSECNHFYKEGYVDSLDHLYTKWFIYQKPTFSSEGILRQVCMNDSSHYIELIIPSLSSDDYDIKVTDELTSDNLSIAVCTYRYEEQTFTFIVYIENKED